MPLADAAGAISGVLCTQVLRNSRDGALGPGTRLQQDGSTLVFLEPDTAALRAGSSQRA